MALPFHPSRPHISLSCLLALSCFFNPASSFNPKHLNLSTVAMHWSSAGATWYGSRDGAGSNGGACGYEDTVSKPPFSSMVAAISPFLYQTGKECGACFQVKCSQRQHPSCSGKPVRVVATDLSPSLFAPAHFDLSGTAFGAMAKPGQEDKLLDAGILHIRYARVACDYPGKNIAFRVDLGSNPNYFAVVVEFEDRDGDLAHVDLKEASSGPHDRDHDQWRRMQQSWGAVWKLDAGSELQPPFSLRLTSRYSGQTLVAEDVIPEGWEPGRTYRSLVNYL
ncbi:hypothetical protein NMG60_11012200 [Bertholletia excelsa]